MSVKRGPPRSQSKTRPNFIMPRRMVGTRGRGAGSFFGTTNIYGPVIAGDQITYAPDDEKDYLRAVADVYSVWRNQYILGKASAGESPFIPTDNTIMVRRKEHAWPGAREQWQRRPVQLPDAIANYRRIVLLGKPGAGKSSYLQYLALNQTRPEAIPGLLPVLVELHTYQGDRPFLTFIQDFLRNPPNPGAPELPIHIESAWLADNLERLLQKGRILLLVDGLNEMARGMPANRARGLHELLAFFHNHKRVRAVMTCRMLDYDNNLGPAGFQTVMLDPWGVEQIIPYLQQRGDSFLLQELENGNPVLLSLGQVPFLLYILTETMANYRPPVDAASTPSFLSSESAIFQQFIDQLLDWAGLKDPEDAALFPRQVVLNAFARLAAAMQSYGFYGTDVPYGWAGAQLPDDPQLLFGATTPPPFDGDPRPRLLEFGCQGAILDTSQTRNTLRFWHMAHQDYFAARALRLAGWGLPDPAVPPMPAPGAFNEETARLPEEDPLAPWQRADEAGGRALGPSAQPVAPKTRLTGPAFAGATDEAIGLAATMAPQPEAVVAQLLEENHPRAALRAARALLGAGGG